MLKILILGTSNSILHDGWVAGLRQALPDADITNLSVGASPGTQFGLNMKTDLTPFDVVFFDSVVNDENLRQLVGEDQFSTRVLYEIISTISAQTPAIVMGFSNARHLDAHSEIYTQRRTLARLCRAQFLGIHELVEKFGRRLLPSDTELFDAGGAHPTRDLQRYFGYALGRLLLSDSTMLRRAPDAVDFSDRFESENATDLAAQGTLLSKANSIMSRSLLEVRPGSSLNFRSHGVCLGLNVNAMETKAIVALDGPLGRRLKDLWYESGAEKFLLKFVPLKDGFPTDRLTVFNASEFPLDLRTVERSPHSNLTNDAVGEGVKLTYASALFWSGRATDPLPPLPLDADSSLKLHHMLEGAIEAELPKVHKL